MTTKHTPGPWEIDGEYVQQAGQNEIAVCDVMVMDEGGSTGWYRGPITQANARLIAAAPDLLQALEALLDMDISYQRGPKVQEAERAARLAVSKARGET